MPADLQVLVQSSLRLTAAREQEMVAYCVDSLAAIKKERGHMAPGQYLRGSWMWKRAIATARYNNDFQDRLGDPSTNVFRNRNLTWNQAKVFVNQNKARMSRDYSGRWFAVTPEGVEDGHPALKPAERYFQMRAADQRLDEMIVNDGIRATLIRGESVYRAIPNRTTQRVLRKARVMLDGNRNPVKDSRGEIVTEFDPWLALPDDPTREYLLRDPNVIRQMASTPYPLSEQAREMLITTAMPSGCDLSFPFWGDCFASIFAKSLDAAEVKGHEFEMKVDDLFDTLPNHLLTPAAQRYYDEHHQGGSTGAKTEHLQPQRIKGELEEKAETNDPGALGRNHYAEFWFRWDPGMDQDGKPVPIQSGKRRRQDLMMLLDVENKWPVWYGPASELLQDGRKHPYGRLRMREVEGRWWGAGHFEEHMDLCEEVDADLCRLSIEKAKSGNILIENPMLTEEGKAGIPLSFRTPSTFRAVGNPAKEDILKVITVQAQTTEIESCLEKNMQALTARGGMLTPGETEASNLDAAQTLGGLQILDKTKTLANDDLEDEITKGIDDLLEVWAELEVRNPDVQQLEELLAGALVVPEMPDSALVVPPLGGAEVPMLPEPPKGGTTNPETLPPAPMPMPEPVKEATLVLQMLEGLKGRKARTALKVVRTKSRSTQIIATQQNVKVLLDEYSKLPGPLRKAQKDSYLGMLQALDHADPAGALEKIDDAMAEIEAMMPALGPDGQPLPPAGGEMPLPPGQEELPAEPVI